MSERNPRISVVTLPLSQSSQAGGNSQRPHALEGEQACGCIGINGLMWVAAQRALEVCFLDLRNSGDTTAERSRVAGYGAFALYQTRDLYNPSGTTAYSSVLHDTLPRKILDAANPESAVTG
jgi:hypothetical protein